MANVPKAITDLPVASAMGDDDLLVVSQNATTSSIKGELIKGYAQNAVASQVTAAQTAANQAGQSATQAEAARQGAAAAQTAAESAQDAAETARDQSVAAAGTIGDSVEQAQTAAGQASSAKDAAVAAQSAAETAKTAAETASGQAKTAATQAAGSATAAQTAATQAGDAKTDAETARNEAETSASSAANSASDAESAAAEAEQAKTYIENMDMEGETLPAGSSVTVTKTTSPEGDLLFLIGVPQGIQGDKGETGETGATGPQGVSVTNATVNEDGDLMITLSAGDPINAGSVIGPQGIQGDVGLTGASVDRIERTSGTGAPGTTDTYTVYLTDGQTGGTFQVYNGSNGTGSGDFMADGSVPMTGDLQMGGHKITNLAEPTDNTDAASKEYVDDTITVSLVGNYIPTGQKGQANGVASLDDSGKVPSAQLPPMDYVPTSRTVNGHALSADVTLDAEDVGARPDTWTPSAEDVGAIPNPSGGTTGQVLTKTSTGEEWSDAPSGLPEGGAEGQMLYKSLNGTEWGDKPNIYVNIEYSDGSYSADKTYEEIRQLLLDGFHVFARYGGLIFVLSSCLLESTTSSIKFFNAKYKSYRALSGSFFEIEPDSSVSNNSFDLDFSDYVPVTRSINGNRLSQDVHLSAEDVNAIENPANGTEGQILAKTSSGAAWVDAPETGLTQEQADDRYLQLTGGSLTGPIYVISDDDVSPFRLLSIYNSGVHAGSFVETTALNGGSTVFIFDSPQFERKGALVITPEGNDIYGSCRFSSIANPTSDTDAANKAYVDSKAPTPVPVTLTTSGWSSNTQTVTVSGVVASETAQLITPTPAIASQSAYYEAGIMCTNQGTNSLTFTCQTVPTSNLTVYVVIQPLG